MHATPAILLLGEVLDSTCLCFPPQVNNPSVDLPVGIVGAVSLCGCLYTGLCLVLCTMVPYNDISIDAPFPAAFLSLIDPSAPSDSMRTAFLRTSSRFVSFGALTGARRTHEPPIKSTLSRCRPAVTACLM